MGGEIMWIVVIGYLELPTLISEGLIDHIELHLATKITLN